MMMNNNIRELAMEAGFASAGFGPGGVFALQSAPQIQKFAQLLLQECAQIALLNDHQETARQIKHHFGL
jgi:hypothetical protein